jgi:hypothetical protein
MRQSGYKVNQDLQMVPSQPKLEKHTHKHTPQPASAASEPESRPDTHPQPPTHPPTHTHAHAHRHTDVTQAKLMLGAGYGHAPTPWRQDEDPFRIASSLRVMKSM